LRKCVRWTPEALQWLTELAHRRAALLPGKGAQWLWDLLGAPGSEEEALELALYRVVEETSTATTSFELIAPLNRQLQPGSEVICEEAAGVFLVDRPHTPPRAAETAIHLAKRVAPFSWPKPHPPPPGTK
jgi:hypothetical protein